MFRFTDGFYQRGAILAMVEYLDEKEIASAVANQNMLCDIFHQARRQIRRWNVGICALEIDTLCIVYLALKDVSSMRLRSEDVWHWRRRLDTVARRMALGFWIVPKANLTDAALNEHREYILYSAPGDSWPSMPTDVILVSKHVSRKILGRGVSDFTAQARSKYFLSSIPISCEQAATMAPKPADSPSLSRQNTRVLARRLTLRVPLQKEYPQM